jgi:hypothetical protein
LNRNPRSVERRNRGVWQRDYAGVPFHRVVVASCGLQNQEIELLTGKPNLKGEAGDRPATVWHRVGHVGEHNVAGARRDSGDTELTAHRTDRGVGQRRTDRQHSERNPDAKQQTPHVRPHTYWAHHTLLSLSRNPKPSRNPILTGSRPNERQRQTPQTAEQVSTEPGRRAAPTDASPR